MLISVIPDMGFDCFVLFYFILFFVYLFLFIFLFVFVIKYKKRKSMNIVGQIYVYDIMTLRRI